MRINASQLVTSVVAMVVAGVILRAITGGRDHE